MSFSWETTSAPSAAARLGRGRPPDRGERRSATTLRTLASRLPRPELLVLILLAGALDLWALSRNGWANDYYSAAVRSMSSSWHNFLFASMDPSGVMTVDKPPLSLWIQTASVRAFGYHPLSVLVPQALMGVASVALAYDLVRRRFGRVGGFAAGLGLATTPIAVAIARHNNPDELLMLCCLAGVWSAVRGLETGRTRWLVLAGVFVGLGFETKMGVALTVVPGIAAAWLWIDPRGRGRLRAFRQLLAGATAMVVVGGAWPLLVELTPTASRPWVAGTSDNRVLSLILDYNGLNRVGGQAGAPPGGGSMSGGTPGPLRLLDSALGGQGGWLLGLALVSCLGMLLACRLRRADPRSGWLIVVGGAFLVTAGLFSGAGGIFHPYYVSLLAPFTAALAGAGLAQLLAGGRSARFVGALAILAGVAVELVIAGRYPGQLPWLPAVLVPVGALAALALLAVPARRVRALALGAAGIALLLAPSLWALDTLGYAANGTFPAGGPASAQASAAGGAPRRLRAGARSASGPGGPLALAGVRPGHAPPFGAIPGGPPPAGAIGQGPPGTAPFPQAGARPLALGGGPRGLGGPFGDARSIAGVLSYVRQHGGGTIAVSSQSSAAAAIIEKNAKVAGIGGFSGRESRVNVAWLAQAVRAGRIRWVLAESTAGRALLPGDTRAGAKPSMKAVASACTRVSVPAPATSVTGAASASSLYDCRGRAGALTAAGAGAG